MTIQHWTDYHAWPISHGVMDATKLALSDTAYAALIGAAQSVSPAEGYLVPREAIEDAALAMPGMVAIQFLAAVYGLDFDGGVALARAIREVRLAPRPTGADQIGAEIAAFAGEIQVTVKRPRRQRWRRGPIARRPHAGGKGS